jgi:antitoxin CcdA
MLAFDDAPKKATNLTLNAKVLELARELGMNVSQTVDALLQEEVRRRYREKWRAQNREAIAAYNERVKRDGVFGDDVRSF